MNLKTAVKRIMPITFHKFDSSIDEMKLWLRKEVQCAINQLQNLMEQKSKDLLDLVQQTAAQAILETQENQRKTSEQYRDVIEQLYHTRDDIFIHNNQSAASILEAVYKRSTCNPLDNFPNGSNAVIPIVFICDSKYVMPTCVAISSLFSNKSSTSNYRIYVIGECLTDADTAMLYQSGSAVEVITVEEHYKQFAHTHPFVSSAALLKFDLPQIMTEWDRILYIDSDVLILQDVQQLLDTDLQDNYAAVVKDFLGMERGHHKRIGHEAYFNSGVMLLNLDRMRKEKLIDTLMEFKKNDPWHEFMDQDAFNCIFQECVVYLPPKYNLMYANNLLSGKSISQMAEFYGVTETDMHISMERPAILHLSSPKKPWDTPLAERYLDYREYAIINDLYRKQWRDVE